MIKIDLKNVQAIGDAHIEIEENTIVEFVGDNSNGKSIISKVIEYMTKGDLIHKDVRCSLINDNANEAVFIITHDNEQLALLLRQELKDSFMMYTADIRNEETRILRLLSDREACDTMIHKFGFRTYSKGDICLQLFPTFGVIPFVTTSGATNNEIVDDITRDKIAEEFIKSFSTITYPIFKQRIETLRREKSSSEAILENIEAYDWRAYEELEKELKRLYSIIQSYQFYQARKLEFPRVKLYPVGILKIPEIPRIKIYPIIPKMGSIHKELVTYVQILNGICPTCGKPLVAHVQH